MSCSALLCFSEQSHPLGVRELKLIIVLIPSSNDVSHPLGVRELKLTQSASKVEKRYVAPFRGA